MGILNSTLQQIGALGAVGAKSVWEVMGELMQAGVATPISIYVDADFQNPQYNVAFIGQGEDFCCGNAPFLPVSLVNPSFFFCLGGLCVQVDWACLTETTT